MTIAIFGRHIIPESIPQFKSLIDFLENKEVKLIFYINFFKKVKQYLPQGREYPVFTNHTEIPDVPFILSLGGDGTMLDCVAYAYNKKAFLIGVNFGRLGFLNSVSIEDFPELFKQIETNTFEHFVRELLKVDFENESINGPNYALNEFCITKKIPNTMLSIKAYINEELLNTYWADGLIVSTPTGSTGYSLSNNGPVIFPQSQCFIITPIAAHNLNVRSVVVPFGAEIKIEVASRRKHVVCMLDARKYTLPQETLFRISQLSFSVKIIRHKEETFTKTIRKKLYWGTDLRNMG